VELEQKKWKERLINYRMMECKKMAPRHYIYEHTIKRKCMGSTAADPQHHPPFLSVVY
jgi:hypothetical protein